MQRQFVDIRIIGQEAEIADLLKALAVVQQLGVEKLCRDITVKVDGRDSGKLKFQVKAKDNRFSPLKNASVDTEDIPRMWIGK